MRAPTLLLPIWRIVKDVGRRRVLKGLPTGSSCAEIGVWRGDFSAKIVKIVRPKVLHLVDPWMYEQDKDYWFGDGVAGGQEVMDEMYSSVVERFANQTAVQIHRKTSVEAATEVEDRSLDWVYIDANHEYQHVLDDLRAWYPKVVSGGLLIGDDYTHKGRWRGEVDRAVDEFVEEVGATLQDVHFRQFVARKP